MAVLSPHANPVAPVRHSRRQAMLFKFNCCQPGNFLTATYRYLAVAAEVQCGRIQTSTMANQVWIVYHLLLKHRLLVNRKRARLYLYTYATLLFSYTQLWFT